MRALDDTTTPLGAPAVWPPSLRTVISLVLGSKFPMFVAWGSQLCFLYNDAYSGVLGGKHPTAMGRPFRDVWSDIWKDISPMVERALRGEASYFENLPLTMRRRGFEEQTWFTFSYSPVRDEGGAVAGMYCACTETTRQVLAERSRLAETERMHRLFHQAPGFMCVMRGPQHVFELTNAAFERLFGTRELLGRPVREALPELAGQGFFELLDRVYASGEPFIGRGLSVRTAVHGVGAELVEHYLDFVYQPIVSPDGHVTGIFVEGSDVTDRHRAEAELRVERDRARAVLDSMGEGFLLLGHDFRILDINAEGLRLEGRPVEQLVGHNHWEVYPGSESMEVGRLYKEAMHTRQPISLEHQYRWQTGQAAWLEMRAYPVPDGLAIFYRDVSDRRNAEARLRESEEHYRLLVDLSPGIHWTADAQGRIESFSERWLALTGLSREEALGDGWMQLPHPQDRAAMQAAWRRSVETGATYDVEYRMRVADGSYHWIRARALAWRNAEGGVQRWYGMTEDVHNRRSAVEALRRLNETLEQRVAAAVAERQRAEEHLRQAQKMEAVGQLTGGIAHDFNNLLQAVTGNLELIRRLAEQPGQVRSWAENALRSVRHGAKLTSQLLAFSRSQRLEMKPVAVNELLKGMQELLTRTLGPSIEVVLALHPDVNSVMAEPTQLEMSVLNLAINARDAMPTGGRLTLSTEVRRLERDAELGTGDYVELRVADTGTGMSPEVVARAFDPFFTTKEVGKGTGLGLSQVYGFARQVGGAARIQSAPSQGTAVSLLLRTAAPAAATTRERQPTGAVKAGSDAGARPARVLVVDDDLAVRSLLRDMLEALGYAVEQAADGPAGLQALERGRPDVLLVDFAMPGMNGAQVARAARERCPDLPIVFASGYADTDALHAAVGPNAQLLHKPFRMDELAATVAKVVAAASA
ncbi:PAS domain-containing protein [Caldimonas brevitalea]|uniref:histidine kinase n=1 Tax=Caldimonas brevitalea TaxID=413882 RepID=A0A0G3BZ80_9BURK|nr:PAS domain-containing protein [Caldimonas brevitalea]AKJ31800.1 sensory box histidine kinase/response regulator [Caldimonas brevitalea]